MVSMDRCALWSLRVLDEKAWIRGWVNFKRQVETGVGWDGPTHVKVMRQKLETHLRKDNNYLHTPILRSKVGYTAGWLARCEEERTPPS